MAATRSRAPHVETLSERTGIRIEDEEVPELTTLSASAAFLVARTT